MPRHAPGKFPPADPRGPVSRDPCRARAQRRRRRPKAAGRASTHGPRRRSQLRKARRRGASQSRSRTPTPSAPTPMPQSFTERSQGDALRPARGRGAQPPMGTAPRKHAALVGARGRQSANEPGAAVALLGGDARLLDQPVGSALAVTALLLVAPAGLALASAWGERARRLLLPADPARFPTCRRLGGIGGRVGAARCLRRLLRSLYGNV
jgi:hypothetical protein